MIKKTFFIIGATATGKTKASIELAQSLKNAEIISADSMQVYKYMDIGTAKITKSEMQGIKHHLIDILNPDDEYSVAHFVNLANECINDIFSRDKIPIVCGGTGFYISALLYNTRFDKFEDKNIELRLKLTEKAEKEGSESLYHLLKNFDSSSAEKIGKNNTKRLIRAIEFFEIYKKPISAHNIEQKNNKLAIPSNVFVLYKDRDKLYKNINSRVDNMIENGLENEVKSILDMGYSPNLISMQAIGYKEIIKYFSGEICKDSAIELIKKNTRKFAKRQETWFRNQLKEAKFYESDTASRCFRNWKEGFDC